MNQVGQTKRFTLEPAPTVSEFGTLAYVWKWWDGTVDATTQNTVTKKLNLGGNLAYDIEVVNMQGQSGSYGSSIFVNSPPVIVRSPTISRNNASFNYTTELQLKAYDPDGGAVSFLWYETGTALGGGTTVTMSGTGTNTFTRNVTQDETLTVLAIDTDAGTQALNFELYGVAPSPPEVIQSALPRSLTSDTANLPSAVIGPDEFVDFTLFASDVTDGSLAYEWAFYGTNGWSVDSFSAGTTSLVSPGVFQNTVRKDISGETAGEKVAEGTVVNVASGQSTVVRSTVTLEESVAPEIASIGNDAPISGLEYQIPLAGQVTYVGTAVDVNGDILDYKWVFTQPSGVTLWGKTITFRPADYTVFSSAASNLPIVGNLTVIDRFGETDSATIPTVTVII